MTTYWVFGKGVAVSQIVQHGPMQAGIPQAQTPSLQRQSSHHTSLAAVVYGMMQASKRTTTANATTRKCGHRQSVGFHPTNQTHHRPNKLEFLFLQRIVSEATSEYVGHTRAHAHTHTLHIFGRNMLDRYAPLLAAF